MSEERKALREKLLSQRKNGYDRIKPEELQAIAVYLAGDMSSYTTGADFRVDGAYTCF